MECPICRELLKAPIYLCKAGHSLCLSCTSKLSRCPTCSGTITKTRNFYLEDAIDVAKFPCPHLKQGCDVYLRQEDMKEHEQVCSYNMHQCIYNECNWRGRSREIKAHAKDEHTTIMEITDVCYTEPVEYSSRYIFSVYNEIFYTYKFKQGGLIYWIVKYIGNPDNAQNYHYEICIEAQPPGKRTLKVSEVCSKSNLTLEEIIEKGTYIALPVKYLTTYEVQAGNMCYNFKIAKDVTQCDLDMEKPKVDLDFHDSFKDCRSCTDCGSDGGSCSGSHDP